MDRRRKPVFSAEYYIGQSLLADIIAQEIMLSYSIYSAFEKKYRLCAGDYICVHYMHIGKQCDLFLTLKDGKYHCRPRVLFLIFITKFISNYYRQLSDEHQCLKKELSRVKRQISEIRRKTENRLNYNYAMEMEESIAANNIGQDNFVTPNRLEFDFSKAYFPELSGGPMTF